jgi:hypothetical protein
MTTFLLAAAMEINKMKGAVLAATPSVFPRLCFSFHPIGLTKKLIYYYFDNAKKGAKRLAGS